MTLCVFPSRMSTVLSSDPTLAEFYCKHQIQPPLAASQITGVWERSGYLRDRIGDDY